MINELDAVILTHDIAEHGLQQDDVGVVVHCHDKGEAFEVEFVTCCDCAIVSSPFSRTSRFDSLNPQD